MPTVKARFTFLYYSSQVLDELRGEIIEARSGIMTISIPTGGDKPYLIAGKKNEVGGWEGRDPMSGVVAAWSKTLPGMYHGYWIEDGVRLLFQIEAEID